MANLLGIIEYNFKKARKELEDALSTITAGDLTSKSVNILQNLNITDELAEVFREKPVVIFQSMDVRILQVNNQIQNALRALDKIDNASLRAIGTKPKEVELKRDEKGRFKKVANGKN